MRQQSGSYGKGGRKPGQTAQMMKYAKKSAVGTGAKKQATKDRMKAQARRTWKKK